MLDRATDAYVAVSNRSFSSVTTSSKIVYWTQREIALLKEHYPLGGLARARDYLPSRSSSAILVKASSLGLHCAARGPRRRLLQDPHFDRELRELYARPPQRGAASKFAEEHRVPRWFVLRRAQILGLAMQRTGYAPWSSKELVLLAENASKSPEVISRMLREIGFSRSATAVVIQLKRRGVDRSDPDEWSAAGLAVLLGVDPKTVSGWIANAGLPAVRRGTRRSERQGGDAWVISRRALRNWIGSHPQLIDLRKVDKFWFLDLAFG